MLLALQTSLTAAQACTDAVDPPACQAVVQNQCGCDVVVAYANSNETLAYKLLVQDFTTKNCPAACGLPCAVVTGGSCMTIGPTTRGVCIGS